MFLKNLVGSGEAPGSFDCEFEFQLEDDLLFVC